MVRLLSWILSLPVAILFMGAGVSHFMNSAPFIGMMRGMPFSSLHPAAVYISGIAEFSLGAALSVAPLAGSTWGANTASALLGLVIAVTPANVNMWVNDVPFGDVRFSYGVTGTHMRRLVAQAVLLVWLQALVSHYNSTADRKKMS